MSRPLPSLNALRAFEAAARLHSVTRAAAELHVTHGAISRQIKLLEQDLGQSLFHRQGRGLELTAAGLQLRDAAGLAFRQLQQAVSELRRGQHVDALVLGCPSSLLARWMIPRLNQLAEDLPNISLHLAAQEGDLQSPQGQLDAVLFLGQPPWPAGWNIIELAHERIGPVVAPALAAQWQLASTPDSLLQHPLLHTTSRPQAWPIWAQQTGLDAARLRMGTGFPHLYHLLEAASAGMGIAIAPEQLVQQDLAQARLLAPWGFIGTAGRWALATPSSHHDPRVPILAHWLKLQLASAADTLLDGPETQQS